VTPTAFIVKWRANARNERAAAQEHFLDLCALLDEPTPNSDPTGAAYAFEKGATKASGGEGWADVWRRGRFAWEYKGKHKDLDAAHRQLLQYAGALENPPLLVTSDIERITIRTNWTNAVSERHEVRLEEMADPVRLGVLKSVFADPERLRPGTTRAALTAKAAAEFAELAGQLRTRGNAPQVVAHFVNRLVFCLFADDVGLLPAGLFERMLDASRKRPAQFEGYARRLFAAMAERGGEVDFTPVAWFNGGLFDDAAALPLEADDIALLQRVSALDWAEVDPSILGTLFERGLDPDKRSQLGAHYTSREMIERLIEPVVRRPLLAEWSEVQAQIAAALAAGTAAKAGSKAKRDAPRRAETLFRGFLDRLRAFRVLDPACGSGNFLYLALLALKDLEHQAMVEAEAIGLQREFPQVGPEAVLGLEVNPYAAELARVSVWIGHIQWARRHGFPAPSDPVLRTLDNIACQDAVLADDGSQAAWPLANVVVGNPPFLGGKRMRTVLGDAYCARLFAAYADQVPAEADLVCYWVARAQWAVVAGELSGAGLVTTNSIRGGANRRVLEPIAQAGAISTAWADEPWTLDGAAVRVSLVCWGRSPALAPLLDGVAVPAIHADLTAGAANLTTARRLPENAGVAFMGDTKGGAFDVPGELARQWLLLPSNANGRPNADVLRPWANGMDVTRRPSDTWIIDFGWTMTEAEAAYYAAPYAYIAQHVRPVRATNKREAYARTWWRHVEARPGMHRALAELPRFVVTPRVAKHRTFSWLAHPTLPDTRLFALARDDDTFFGILHSQIHEVWSLATASWHGVGNDPTYNATVCFETFPFPPGLTPDCPAVSYAGNPHAQAIAEAAQALAVARDRWLNPPELVIRMPEVVPGFPERLLPRDASAAATLRTRTLTALYNQRGKPEGVWLDGLHRALDEAVAAAYDWPPNLSNDDILARLLALNHARPERLITQP
jgi:type II restriction/modification system DNA methylase subunit YeeA